MRILVSITMVLAVVFGAWGNPSVKLTYCGEPDAGYGDSGGVVTPWVVFPAEMTQIYVGSSLTKVRFALNSKANNVTVYLKHSPEDVDPFYSKKIGTLEAGWHEIDIDEPYVITPGENVAVGYKATFTKANGAGYTSGATTDEASHAFYNTKNMWIDVKGAFCIEAILEGESLITDELSLTALTSGMKDFFQDYTPIFATVQNLGSNVAETFTLSYSVDGATAVEVDFEGPLEPGESKECELDIPETGIGLHQVEVSVVKVNGNPDSFDGNNTMTTTVTERDPAFIKRVVVEEGTANWCSWCPRGIVGLDMMVEKYPHQFIPIAVHVNDPYAVDTYKPSMDKMPSLPNSYVDRYLTGDPYYDIESNFLKESLKNCDVAYDILDASVSENVATVRSKVMVAKEMQASGLATAFTVTEDNVWGLQANSYSGSSEPMGGWELEAGTAECYYLFVARGIYPSYSGECFLEGTLVPGEEYEFTYEFELPENIKDVNNIAIVGQMIDRGNGFILNAAKVAPRFGDDSSVGSIDAVSNSVIFSEVYTIDGRCVTAGTHSVTETLSEGIYIVVDHYSDGTVKTTKFLKHIR